MSGSLYASRYRALAQIGKGNFAQVFLVHDTKGSAESREQKVMKRLAVNGIEAAETMDVVHEAKLMQKLEHPHIIRCLDSFLEGEFFCIVSEYCEQGDLHEYLSKLMEQAAYMQEQEILSWFAQLVSAVEHMHSRGVLHRDLKTKNVFIRRGVIKVGDFGISRVLTATNNVAQTFVGTPCYMSPEVFKHEDYGAKSDVWSLGCILVEMCTLKRAFDGSSLMDVMCNILQKEPPRLPSHYSSQLQSLSDRILIREQNDRPSAADILRMDIVARYINRRKGAPTGDSNRIEQKARLKKSSDNKSNPTPDEGDEAAQDFADIVEKLEAMNEAWSTADAKLSEELRADAERKLGQHFAAVYALIKKARVTSLKNGPMHAWELQETLQKLVGFHLLPHCRLVEKLVAMEQREIWATSPPHGTGLTGFYALTRKPHGLCLIINNYDYDKMPTRLGAINDEKAVSNTFKRLSFTVDVRRNLTASEIMDVMRHVSARLENQMDECFACYVMAYGEEAMVAGVDGKFVTLAALLKPFDKQRQSARKPKVFLMELVRGIVQIEPRCREETVQLPSNCLVVQRTTKAPKGRRRGLIFTRALCDSLNRWAIALDFEAILILVNDYFQRVSVDWSHPDSLTVKLVNAFTKQSSLQGRLKFTFHNVQK